jgi:hypothetical protein
MKGFLLKAVLLMQLALATCQQIQPSEDNHVVRVKVEEVVPRHLCRRALRNLEVRNPPLLNFSFGKKAKNKKFHHQSLSNITCSFYAVTENLSKEK